MPNRNYPPKHQCDAGTGKSDTAPKYSVSNADLKKLAHQFELEQNNNNVFNGKNLSDNTKVTSFYTLKAKPTYQSPLLYFGSAQPAKKAEKGTPGGPVPESSKIKEIFTSNVALNQCDNCKHKDAAPQKVSNLVEDPKLNLKYDDAWFLKQNPQHWNNIRTMGLIKDIGKEEEEDPIMKLNPTLYKVV